MTPTTAMRLTGSRRRDERGDALVIFCVAMVLIILPLGGISLDLWRSISDDRALQSAADAAVAAGTGAIDAAAYRADPSHPVLDPAQATTNAATILQTQTDLPVVVCRTSHSTTRSDR